VCACRMMRGKNIKKRCIKLKCVLTDYRGKMRSVESDAGKDYGSCRRAGRLNERTYGINISDFLTVPLPRV
jgi:hypothetical protein